MRAAAFFLLGCAAAFASADTDWQALAAMDAGPQAKPKTVEEAREAGRAHIAAQLALAKAFQEKHAADPRAVEAGIRAASLEAALGMADGKPAAVEGAMRALLAIERNKSVPPAQRAEAGFRRVSLLMQSFRGREIEKRSDILAAARNFAARHPGDRRVPRVLVEVATICDNDPELKRALLVEAQALARGEPLRRRIADDLRRMDLLGKPFSVEFPTLQGGKFDSKSWRGKIGFLVFWSAESAPSVLWLQEFRSALRKLPGGRIGVATVALDKDAGLVGGVLAEAGIAGWPAAVETQGWESPLARRNGVNALPAVFVIDQAGVLRSVNARNSYESWVRALLVGRQPAP